MAGIERKSFIDHVKGLSDTDALVFGDDNIAIIFDDGVIKAWSDNTIIRASYNPDQEEVNKLVFISRYRRM